MSTWRRGTVRVWQRLGDRKEYDGHVHASGLFGIYRRGDGRWMGVHLRTGRGCSVNQRTLTGAKERVRRILERTGLDPWRTDFGFDEDLPNPQTEEGREALRALARDISHPDTYVGGNQ